MSEEYKQHGGKFFMFFIPNPIQSFPSSKDIYIFQPWGKRFTLLVQFQVSDSNKGWWYVTWFKWKINNSLNNNICFAATDNNTKIICGHISGDLCSASAQTCKGRCCGRTSRTAYGGCTRGNAGGAHGRPHSQRCSCSTSPGGKKAKEYLRTLFQVSSKMILTFQLVKQRALNL